MRKIFFLICLLSSLCAMAQKTIFMEKEAGVYKIPCKVNGAKMKMIFDTGASSVAISLPIAEYLYENDYITKDDIIGTGKSQVADGRIVDNVIVNLRDIEIEGIHVYNVQATVSESLTAPLLFGQSAIQKLGKISLHGNILTIEDAYDYSVITSEIRVKDLKNKARTFYKQENYYMTVRYLLELENISRLGLYEYYMLCDSYYELNERQNCYDATIRFEQNCKKDIDAENAGCMYQRVATTLRLDENYLESIKWCKKAIGTLSLYNNREHDVSGLYDNMGFMQMKLKEYFQSISSYKKAIELQCKFLYIPNDGIAKDNDLARLYYNYALAIQCYRQNKRNSDVINYMKKSVRCGSENAKKYLKSIGY